MRSSKSGFTRKPDRTPLRECAEHTIGGIGIRETVAMPAVDENDGDMVLV